MVDDEISIRKSSSVSNHFISNRSRLAWKKVTIDESIGVVFKFYFLKPAEEVHFYRGPLVQWKWRRQCCGFEFGRFIPLRFGIGTKTPMGPNPPWQEDIWIIPYWSITIPLTLISLWLLLTKSLKSSPKNSTESIPETVA